MGECNETYVDGCEFKEGVYKNYSQFCTAKERNIHGFIHLFLWINYAALSVSGLLSCSKSMNEFCQIINGKSFYQANGYICSQIILLWKSMHSRFGLKQEELEQLLMEVMLQFIGVSLKCFFYNLAIYMVLLSLQHFSIPKDSIFEDHHHRNLYEQDMITNVFQPAMRKLSQKVSGG